MAEPEEIVIEAARHATVFVSRLWHRSDKSKDSSCTLPAYKQRLELLLAAVHGHDIPVRVAQRPAPMSVLSRLFGKTPRHLIEQHALPANDGAQIFLPARLASDTPLQFFRILALQQAGRAKRRAAFTNLPADTLTQDLFYLSEAVAVDHRLALDFPGLMPDLVALRRDTLSGRSPPALLNPPEQAVEDFYYCVLRTHPARAPFPMIVAAAADDSLTWAAEMARGISTKRGVPKIRYRGICKDLWLARTLPLATAQQMQPNVEATTDVLNVPPRIQRTAQLSRRPEVRKRKEDEDDAAQGMWMLQMDDPQQHVEDPAGMQRPTDRDDNADAGDIADSLSELPEACLISTPKPALEVLLSDDPPTNPRTMPPSVSAGATAEISYPEWDFRIAAYREAGVVVRVRASPLGNPRWAESVLAGRHALLRQVQRRFEGMRPRRTKQDRQPDGNDIDISAYVNALAEQHTGLPLDDCLYRSVRPARRDIAIALLIDISGSTDGWVSDDLRIIDVEKEALLLVYRALVALGDPFCIHAFSGESAQNVTLWPVKGFDESDGNLIQCRIAALEPQYYTRAGAAIRHTTSLLAARPSQHRLLILLSDGKPNDVDQYEGRYGVEDMRQAIAEATRQSVHPFCLTVDRQAPQYLAGIFGSGRYAVLQHPQLLPIVLVDVLRKLIKM
jgi:nitric oxide reductase NorD protein